MNVEENIAFFAKSFACSDARHNLEMVEQDRSSSAVVTHSTERSALSRVRPLCARHECHFIVCTLCQPGGVERTPEQAIRYAEEEVQKLRAELAHVEGDGIRARDQVAALESKVALLVGQLEEREGEALKLRHQNRLVEVVNEILLPSSICTLQ